MCVRSILYSFSYFFFILTWNWRVDNLNDVRVQWSSAVLCDATVQSCSVWVFPLNTAIVGPLLFECRRAKELFQGCFPFGVLSKSPQVYSLVGIFRLSNNSLRGYTQEWNKLWKTGRAKNFIFFCSCPLYSSLPQLIGGTCHFLPSSWSHACCDHNESESYRPTISVGTVLTSRQIRQFSPNLIRTTGSEAVKKWEGKDLFSPPCI